MQMIKDKRENVPQNPGIIDQIWPWKCGIKFKGK